ncbi:MAG: aspartate aminotransferase family protein [Candidatus Buchananbacteria bacterium CG10_big_fil_rev_8_21_14_0_10_42_9]|uniref:Aspartate aminotransferase family protein n=1 Tax=Candidatus Buchananbacteria bacterium CG10_big_fil_rev_8_21_14_0_10_42_9 TaxID=1974526 RepID=A0A2H0W1X0_9BACT|nr:MAG: aspartate aminotransferase family protein [Candidatus Buchananbacteria bacterium CG10_big_fil_rev_8_21_14_0_10_42_9]
MTKKFTQSNQMFKKVKQVIPLASQTFSKSYLQYVKGQAPLFVTRAQGAHIWDVDGNEYIDMINGLLPVILGYQYPAVDKAIREQLNKGITFSLSSTLEYELAKLLVKHIPCAEMVRFGKNGSDATTGAVRVARAYTGRDHIAVGGYHGWHDWYIGSTARSLGVPKSTRALTHTFKYNDITSLKKLMARHKLAAVILEPMNYVEPQDDFLHQVRKLTRQHGALLIFDEIITGFRYHLGGAQKLFGVTPDLATFGKSMGNGMPIAALVGKRKYMKIVDDIFYSFTFGGEALSLAASIATIKEMERKKVIPAIWKKGKYLQMTVNKLLKQNGLEDIISVAGKPCWQVFIIQDARNSNALEIKTYIQQELLQRGILWLGQHNMSFSHTQKDLEILISAYKGILPELKKLLDNGKLTQALRGKPITNIFKVR